MTTIPQRKTSFHICKCGYSASNITSWTKKNPGRIFQACQFYEQDTDSRGCDFFKWVDIEMTKWQNDVTNSLMDDVNMQKIELRILKKELADVVVEKGCLQLENQALKDQLPLMKKHGLMLPAFCCLLVFVPCLVFVAVVLVGSDFAVWKEVGGQQQIVKQAEKKQLVVFHLQPLVVEDNNIVSDLVSDYFYK
uniref:GRF-type domain-containing protein n=1 Tax=Chenopodium quinoa TaxID=63459 RepID=A0A803L333_CHEQI